MTDQSTLSLDELLAQEARLQFASFDHDTAWRLGGALVEAARARGVNVTVDIRIGDQQVFHAAMAGTTADNDDWIARKIRVVRRFGHSSYYVGRSYTDRGADFADQPHLEPALYAAHGGCFPVLVRGAGAIGTITVSGLPQAVDHELLVTTLEALLLGR
ncbi:MAG: hypothetical protein QOK14_1906 [Frankiaceae bacterium]|jgi:uncharacterized protein (UPF0303 family)|nr:hypothetical protein [Frankiaceae bacterium]